MATGDLRDVHALAVADSGSRRQMGAGGCLQLNSSGATRGVPAHRPRPRKPRPDAIGLVSADLQRSVMEKDEQPKGSYPWI